MQRRTIDFSKYSSIRIGSEVDVAVIEEVDDADEMFFMVGGAYNLLVSPYPPPLAVLGEQFEYIELEDDIVRVGAATKGGRLLSFAKKHDFANFEFLSNLPGTLGGMVMMNAGVKEHELFNHLIGVQTEEGFVPKEQIEHGYRYCGLKGTVFEAQFEATSGFDAELLEQLKELRKNQPTEPSAGSCFKNPPGDYAGRLIEAVGLKGATKGDMAFSQKHANFLVNLGKGCFEDAIWLIDEAKRRVQESFGVQLELEVKVV